MMTNFATSEQVLAGKRKSVPSGVEEIGVYQSKRVKHSPHLLPDLSHVVGLCLERIPLATIATHLEKRGILHQGLNVEAVGTGLALKLVNLPQEVEGVSHKTMTNLNRRLLSAAVRMQVKGSRKWILELIFNGQVYFIFFV